MANYATLKSAIQQVVKTNGNNEITGALLQQTLFAMVNSLGADYQFAGMANPATTPGTPDQNVFYISTTPGLYANFGGKYVTRDEIVIFRYNGSWSVLSTNMANGMQVDFNLQFYGVGTTITTKRFNLVAGRKYIFTIDNPNWSKTQLGSLMCFSIGRNNGTSDVPLASVSAPNNPQSQYTFTAIESANYYISFRGDSGEIVNVTVDVANMIGDVDAAIKKAITNMPVRVVYTTGMIPNIDTSAKTIDFGGDLVMIHNGNRYIISNRSVSLYDSAVSSSVQLLVFNSVSQTFSCKPYTYTLANDEFIVGITRFSGTSLNYNKSWFPFDFTENRISTDIENTVTSLGEFCPERILALSGKLDNLAVLFDYSIFNFVSQSEFYWKSSPATPSTTVIGFRRGLKIRLKGGDKIAADGVVGFRPYIFYDNGTVYSSWRTAEYQLSGDATVIIEMRISSGTTITDVANLANKLVITRDISAAYNDWAAVTKTDVSTPVKSVSAQANRYNPQYRVIENSRQIVKTETGYRSAIRYKDVNGTTLVDFGFVAADVINSHSPVPGAVICDILFEKIDGTALVNSTYATKADAINDNCSIINIECSELIARAPSTQQLNAAFLYNQKRRSIRSVAHQGFFGFSGGIGNNMAQYYEKAAQYGFDFGECDIKFSSDNVPVCCHDATFVDEATQTTITISEHTFAELQTYTYHGGKISSFDEVVKVCKINGIGLYVDHVTGIVETTLWNQIFNVLKKYSFFDSVVWLINSGSQNPVNTILSVNPNAKICVLTGALNQAAITFANGIKTVNNEIHIDFDYSQTSVAELISLSENLAAGILLEAYTIDSYARYLEYLPYVVGITSNRVCEKWVSKYYE